MDSAWAVKFKRLATEPVPDQVIRALNHFCYVLINNIASFNASVIYGNIRSLTIFVFKSVISDFF